MEVFNRFREKRLQTLPLDLLAITPTIESSKLEQQIVNKPPVVENIYKKGKEPEQDKELEKGNEHMGIDT